MNRARCRALAARRLALLAVLGAPACHGRAAEQREPELVLLQTRHDFGAVVTHDSLTHVFQLRNAGHAPLVVASIEPGHECSVATTGFALNGESSMGLTVQCRPEHYGAFLSTVVLGTNDARAPRVVLELAAQVTPLLAWDRPLLAFTLPFGGEHTEQLSVQGTRAREARLAPIAPVDPALTLELRHTADGEALAVTAHANRVGTQTGELKMSTGLGDPSELALPYSLQVTGTLQVDPSNPYFDLVRAEGQKVALTVSSAQPGFRVLGVDVLAGPFRARFSGKPSGPYRVELTFLPERAEPEARGALGRIRLRSTDRSEPEKLLDLFAFGQAAQTTRP